MVRGLLILLTMGFCVVCCIEWWDVQAEYAAQYGRVPEFLLGFQVAWWVGMVALLLGAVWLDRCISAARAGQVAVYERTGANGLQPVMRWIAIAGMAILTGAGAWCFIGGFVMFPLFMDFDGSSTAGRLATVLGALYTALCVLAGVLGGTWVFVQTRCRVSLADAEP